MKSRKDNFEKNFIFNVPQNFRFSKFEKLKETPDIDFDDEDDVWFTLDHP